MRRSQGFWVLVALSFLSFSSILAHANGLPPGDPGMQVDDPTCTPTLNGGQTQDVMSGQIFTFTADSSGGGCAAFMVVGNAPFEKIDFQFGEGNAVPSDLVTCSSDAFQCTPSNLDDGTVTDVFFTANVCDSEECRSGFPVGTPFTVLLSGFNPGTKFYGDGNLPAPADNPNLIQQFNAPEPSSVFLLSAGAGALALRRKISKRSV